MIMLFLLLLPCIMHAQEFPWAHATLQNMNLREKIGQLFVVRTVATFNQKTERLQKICNDMCQSAHHEKVIEFIKKYKIGGVLFLCNSTLDEHIAVRNTFQKESDIPLLTWLDAENGLTMRIDDALRFP